MHTRLDFIYASVITQPEIQKKIKIQIKFELIISILKKKTIILSPPLKLCLWTRKPLKSLLSLIFSLSPKSPFVNFRPPPSVSFLLHTQMEYLHLQSFSVSLSLSLFICGSYMWWFILWTIQETVMVKLTIVGRVEDGLPLAQDQTYVNQQDNASFLFYRQQAELLLKQISKDPLLHPKMTILLDHHSFQYHSILINNFVSSFSF